MKKIEVKKLKDLADIIAGSYIPSNSRLKKGTWQLIRGRNIKDHTVKISDVFVPEELVKKNFKSIIVPGDILLTTHFGQDKVAIVPKNLGPAIADKGLVVIRPKHATKEYLHNYLKSKTGKSALVGQLAQMTRGGVIKFVTLKDISNLDIPLIPHNLLAVNVSDQVHIKDIVSVRRQYESDMLTAFKELLLQKGWKDEEVSQEVVVSGRMRADFILNRKGKPVALVEIKKDARRIKSVEQQLKMLTKISGVNIGFIVTGDGIKLYDVKKDELKDVAEMPSPEDLS